MNIVHQLIEIGGRLLEHQPSKIVCVGRNYLEHIHELNNPVPEVPLLFIKPTTSLCPIEAPIPLRSGQGALAYELELALVMGEDDYSHVGLALDLTLRDLQNQLKTNGHPWERAKAFDGACPITPMIPREQFIDAAYRFTLDVNGVSRQRGDVSFMITSIPDLLAEMKTVFTLLPGDIVLTGTPKGVGQLAIDDVLSLSLNDNFHFQTRVVAN